MMPRELEAELLEPTGAELGEGARWDAARRRLLWVDITRGQLRIRPGLDPGTRSATVDLGVHVGAVAPPSGEDVVAATTQGF
jgi:sugar lactone lactonase YvrE